MMKKHLLSAVRADWFLNSFGEVASYLVPSSDADLHGFFQAVGSIQTVYRPCQVQLEKQIFFLLLNF